MFVQIEAGLKQRSSSNGIWVSSKKEAGFLNFPAYAHAITHITFFYIDTTTNEKRILFLEEIALMKKVSEIGNNHVVQLLGCITLKTPMAMVMEFCPFGDLRSNLIQWREEASEYGACCY